MNLKNKIEEQEQVLLYNNLEMTVMLLSANYRSIEVIEDN